MNGPILAVAVAGLCAGMATMMSGNHSDAREGFTNSSDLLVAISFVLAALVMFVVIGITTREIPLPPEKDSKVRLGDPKYDLSILESPTASGMVLQVLAKLLGNRLYGHIVVRHLMNDNRPDLIRELARQAAKEGIPVVSEPLCRIDNTTVTDEMAATCTDAIQQGLARSYDNTDNDHQVLGVMDYHQAYITGAVKPSQMMEQVLKGMDQLEFLNMFVACHRDDVMEQAKGSDQRWADKKPLSVFDGVPVAVKDMVKVKGYQCSVGKKLRYCDKVHMVDDLMVERFRKVGAIILGTTTMTEYGRCPLGYNSHWKGPFNPHNELHYSGGSSSGSVCSVITGLCPIALAFDGGGSIRLPAALSGAYGLAPTFGRVPWSDDVTITSGYIHAGVNTATTTDTALAYSLLAQNEPGNFASQFYDGDVQGPPRPHLTGFDEIDDFGGLKIGVFWDYFNDSDPEVAAACKAAIAELEKKGAKVVEVSIPHLKALSLAHSFGISTFFTVANESDFYERDDLEPGSKIQLQVGKVVSGVEFMSANRMRGWAMKYIKKLFAEEMDVFITPGCPIVAPRIPPGTLACGDSNFPLIATVMRYVFLVNLAGFPGMTIPIGYSQDDKLPISLQVMGDHWNDALLLRLSHFVEKNIFQRKTPKHFVKMSIRSK